MAIYYISTSGNDSNNGSSPSTPWQSLSKVRSFLSTTVQPGDEVRFKCGDVWTGQLNIRTIWGGTAKSGTAQNPIIIGTYGTGAKPRIIGPTTIASMHLAGVNYYIIDGFNFEDTVTDPNDKVTAAPVKAGIQLGQYGEITSNNITIKNCNFSNIAFGIIIVGDYNKVNNCTMTNMKNWKSTKGTDANGDGIIQQTEPGADDDYGSNCMVVTGNYNEIMYNWLEGAWAESWDYGWDGGAIEMFDTCNYNKIMYNTIVDCEGVSEFGGYNGTGATCIDNVFAYNKIINCGSITWVNVTGGFSIQPSNLQYYNNIVIENYESRFAGPNLGKGIKTPEILARIMADPATRFFAHNGSPTASVVFNLKNNFFYIENGQRVIGSPAKTQHENNVYKFVGTSSVGDTLRASEKITTNSLSQIIKSAVGSPRTWDFTPQDNSILINAGQNVGLSKDFNGNSIVGLPDAGVIEYTSVVTPPSPLIINVTFTPIGVFGGTSTITVTASGGTTPYTGIGTFTRSAGIHEFTVIDSTGQTATQSITITQPAQLLTTANYTPISINGGTTTVTLSASGGVSPYTYSKDNITFTTNNVFSGLVAGTYTFYTKDTNGAIVSTTVTLTQPTSSFIINGVTVRTKNGITPLTYSIDGGLFTTNATFSNLIPGKTYTIRAKDGTGVIRTMTIIIQS